MTFVVWGILLLLQNSSHTLSSRAKNSRSLLYNAATGVFSNGVWFASQYFIVTELMNSMRKGWMYALSVGAFYIACTVAGSVGSHWLAMHWLEKKYDITRG